MQTILHSPWLVDAALQPQPQESHGLLFSGNLTLSFLCSLLLLALCSSRPPIPGAPHHSLPSLSEKLTLSFLSLPSQQTQSLQQPLMPPSICLLLDNLTSNVPFFSTISLALLLIIAPAPEVLFQTH